MKEIIEKKLQQTQEIEYKIERWNEVRATTVRTINESQKQLKKLNLMQQQKQTLSNIRTRQQLEVNIQHRTGFFRKIKNGISGLWNKIFHRNVRNAQPTMSPYTMKQQRGRAG